MSEVVTLDVRVLKTWDRHVLVDADGVKAVLAIADIDLVPGPTPPWSTLTIERRVALQWCLVRDPPEDFTVGIDVQHDGLAALITHRHYGIQPGEPAA